MSLINQLNSIFQEVFDDPNLVVNLGTSPREIADWDSVAQVKLVLAVEESFGVRFATDDVSSLDCAGDFLAVLSRGRGAAQ
jgi:acyl carrier protein